MFVCSGVSLPGHARIIRAEMQKLSLNFAKSTGSLNKRQELRESQEGTHTLLFWI